MFFMPCGYLRNNVPAFSFFFFLNDITADLSLAIGTSYFIVKEAGLRHFSDTASPGL